MNSIWAIIKERYDKNANALFLLVKKPIKKNYFKSFWKLLWSPFLVILQYYIILWKISLFFSFEYSATSFFTTSEPFGSFFHAIEYSYCKLNTFIVYILMISFCHSYIFRATKEFRKLRTNYLFFKNSNLGDKGL